MKTLLTFSLLVLMTSNGFTQETERQYHTIEYLEQLSATKAFQKAQAQLERAHRKTLRFTDFKDHTIPVVFHILHTNEEERIPQEKLIQQLDILNQDFADATNETYKVDLEIGDRRNLAKYNKRRANAGIEFCFARKNKNKSAINYLETSVAEWSDFYAMKEQKSGSSPWNTKQYLNVWICNLPEGNSGFAQMPGGPDEFDGIVIDYQYIQNIGNPKSKHNAGHTLTHLVGNYLGLYPLWGPRPCADDLVDDTPIHNGPNFRCESIQHLSTCSGYPTEMINNFMDNTDDACLSMFTQGQINRMQAFLSEKGPRGQLSIKSSQCGEEPALTEELSLRNGLETKIPTNQGAYTLSAYPNPTNDRLFIYFQHEKDVLPDQYEVQIFSVSGALMFRQVRLSTEISMEVNVSQWPSGTYLLKINNRAHKYQKQIVVE